ncbi:MOSC domain-containing protein [Alkalihalophilus lindianensis]|uniref:MOSC domain-containing protein n=1 Tax=Alkalihalophilus lindianensis TaxID=1630542 RepID=A0ABU3XCR4_9BACI|nr:MOSC domain-containing protein [Alkalihalophilus lindianensis]MDV2685665.1 MOSC domain-containing protein [Alkalihalophilus lindianensis]
MSKSIQAIHLGIPREIEHGSKIIKTSIFKEPTENVVSIHSTGINGDTQADLIHHGGVDKAICAYPYEHYSFWENKLSQDVGSSAFGENLTLIGWLEKDVHIGDVFELGSAIIQVSQPRHPCFKLGLKHKQPKIPLWVKETGFSGYYFRVVKEGEASLANELIRIEKRSEHPTIMEVNECRHNPHATKGQLEAMVEIKELALEWQDAFRKKLTTM